MRTSFVSLQLDQNIKLLLRLELGYFATGKRFLRIIEGRLLVKLKIPKNIVAGENIDSRPSMVELSNYLKLFPVKARTIRQQIWPPPVLDSPGVSSCDQDNNHSPQVLSSEASVQPDSSGEEDKEKEKEREKKLGSGDDSGKLKRKLEETENGPGRGDHKIQKTDSGVDYPKISDTDHDGETRELDIDIKNSTSSRVREGCTDDQPADIKNRVASSPAAPKTPKIYACSFCSKAFSSHLALGGHKSSHNKFKMVIIYNAIDQRRKKQYITNTCHQETGKIASSENNAATPKSVGDDRTHTCKICFEKFPSGQALGGHHRRHWSGNMTEQKTQSAPKILDFDLNELPKEEDEDRSSKCRIS